MLSFQFLDQVQASGESKIVYHSIFCKSLVQALSTEKTLVELFLGMNYSIFNYQESNFV